MRIRILEFVEGAREAKGMTVIIDVFRAFSVACYAFDAGASRVITVENITDAFAVRKLYKRSLLAGERDERRIEGFDIGNSPTEIIELNLDGITLIHTTTAGTRGLASAENAETLLAASLVNASAVAEYIIKQQAAEVSLVAMGYRGSISAEEDLICAEFIEDRIKGGRTDFSARIAALRENSGKRFFNPSNLAFSPPTDFFLCTMTDRFDFVLKAEKRDDGFIELFQIQ